MGRRFAKIADGIVSVTDAMAAGKSFESAFYEFCENSSLPLYFKAQVGYGVLERMGIDMTERLRSVPFSQLLEWKNRSETIREMVPVPSDKEMLKTLSRPSRTDSPLWEAQGHRHQTDELSLLERVYMVHEQLEADTRQI
ncbi:MAG: hypothetical protein IJK52_12875 [Oscillospiraceae bacterium]|nr:hypothetical protein [Oscillospiraceae bacterium]